jgi:uncharacterized membrane protein
VTERGLRAAIAALAAAGVAIAAYLTWIHYQPGALVCLRGSTGCETVSKSSYAELGGVPVALLGLVAYVVLLVSAFLRALVSVAAAAAIALAGLAFAGWLVYVQASILDAWCAWCLASDVVLTLLAAACVLRLVRETARV